MLQYLEDPLEISILEDVEEEIFLEDYDENIETYEDEEINDYLAKRNNHLIEVDDDYEDDVFFELPSISSEEEDTWWALTDGMYGDCPTNPLAYDAALEAMGF